MARRQRNQSTNNEAEEANVSTTTTETPAETPEAVEGAVEATSEEVEAAPKATEAEVDLTAFENAVNEALANKDESTGELAPSFIEPVNAEYRKLDGLKAKNKAKAVLNEGMKSAMNDMDIQTARAYLALTDNLSAAGGGGSKAPSQPADPTEAFVQKAATLRLALGLVTNDVPEGVNEGWADKAKELVDSSTEAARNYQQWLASPEDSRGDEPEVNAVVKAAVKLASGKSARLGRASSGGGSGFTGERRDIAKHIVNAFADKPSGTFLTIAEIKNTHSDEYGDNSPSAGAVSARLFPNSGKCTVEGITPGTNDKGKKGATKD